MLKPSTMANLSYEEILFLEKLLSEYQPEDEKEYALRGDLHDKFLSKSYDIRKYREWTAK